MSQSNQKKQNRRHRKKQSWPVMLLLAGGVLLIAGAMFAFRKPQQKAAIEVAGAPSLKVDQEKVDLGYIKLGQTVEVKFKLTNVGDQTLRFSKTPFIEVVEGC
jgi:hypothetical protein